MLRITFTPQDLARGDLGPTRRDAARADDPAAASRPGDVRRMATRGPRPVPGPCPSGLLPVPGDPPGPVHRHRRRVVRRGGDRGAARRVDAASACRARGGRRGAGPLLMLYGPLGGCGVGRHHARPGDREELLAFLQDVHRVAVAPHSQRILPRLRAEQTRHAEDRLPGATLQELYVERWPEPGFRCSDPFSCSRRLSR